MQYLAQARESYPDARHHCWAYIIGDPENPKLVAMSDDGEPSGTAGKPILNVMQHKAAGDIMIIVIRYFGGIKLGAGGLVRAYSSATQSAYEQVSLNTPKDTLSQALKCGFADEQRIRHWLALHEAQVLSCDYEKDVIMEVELETCHYSELEALIDGLKGAELTKEL